MKAKWFCKDCYNSAGVDVEIYTIANVFGEQCVICDARADYLVAEPKRLLTKRAADGALPRCTCGAGDDYDHPHLVGCPSRPTANASH